MPDYYRYLEVSPTATQSEIKRSYRRLARKYHPDLNQVAVDQQIKQLNEAYQVLGDPQKRAAYDQQRRLEAARRRASTAPRPEPRMTWIEGIFGFVKELRRELREK